MNLFLALTVTPELRDAISQAHSAVQRRADADLAVAANARGIEAANTIIPELESLASRLHAEAIKCEALASAKGAAKSEVNKAVKAADNAALDLAAKKCELERATAARNVLADMARDADTSIVLAKAAFTSALAAYREQPLGALEDDLRAACAGRAALRDVVAAARAVDANFPGGLCTPLLDNLKIISPLGYRVIHDDIGRARVSGSDLLAEEAMLATLPEEAALSLREINALVDALKRHRPFTMPKLTEPTAFSPKRTEAEQRRFDSAVRENEERQRISDEEQERREARSREPYEKKSQVREPGTPAPSRTGHANAAHHHFADDDGTVSAEWRRIGVLQPSEGDVR
jgi:hypothetical protein